MVFGHVGGGIVKETDERLSRLPTRWIGDICRSHHRDQDFNLVLEEATQYGSPSGVFGLETAAAILIQRRVDRYSPMSGETRGAETG